MILPSLNPSLNSLGAWQLEALPILARTAKKTGHSYNSYTRNDVYAISSNVLVINKKNYDVIRESFQFCESFICTYTY